MKSPIPMAVLVIAILAIASCSDVLIASDQTEDGYSSEYSPWPMFGGNAQHTGSSSSNASSSMGGVKWTFTTNYWGTGFPSPSIGPNGTIYVSSSFFLHALDINGTETWTWTISWPDDIIQTTPAIDTEGNIYFGSTYHFYALNPNGTVKWCMNRERIFSSPVIDENGVIYFGTTYYKMNGAQIPDQTYLYSIYPNGTERWKAEIDPLYSSPGIMPDGNIIAATKTNLICFNDRGELIWRHPLRCSSSPCITGEGCILIVSENADLYSFYPNGTMKWKFTPSPIHDSWRTSFSTPALGINDKIYFGSPNGIMYALNSDGSVIWTYQTGDGIYMSPAIDSEGTIFFTSSDGFLYALNSNGSLKWKFEVGPSDQFSPIIGSDGTVYVGGGDISKGRGYFYAFNGSPREIVPGFIIVPGVLIGLCIIGLFVSRRHQ